MLMFDFQIYKINTFFFESGANIIKKMEFFLAGYKKKPDTCVNL
jgi:hypothetical protein